MTKYICDDLCETCLSKYSDADDDDYYDAQYLQMHLILQSPMWCFWDVTL